MLCVVDLQFLYASNLQTSEQKLVTSLSLGLWHSYKVACERLWFIYLPFLIGPAYHSIAAQTNVYGSPSLFEITHFFTRLRLAYPDVKASLAAALMDDKVSLNNKLMLQNIQDFFEFFLPVVSENYRTLMQMFK